MKYSLEPITITKGFLLSKIPEEQIMEHYLGIKMQKGLFKSPLRKDNNPTCSFFRNRRGRLMMKDFSGAFCGDCFNVVMEIHKCSYYMALQIIANDFGIIHRADLTVNKPKIEYSGETIKEVRSARIQVRTREFNEIEIKWWLRYGITLETLNAFHVYPIDSVWINEQLFYQRLSDTKMVFGYYGGIKNDSEQWRIYFPDNKHHKFISNWKANQIQGAHLLKNIKSNYIVVTKSLKDCAALYEFGIPAIAPCSENLFLSEAQYTHLRAKFEKVFLLYDMDLPGISASKKIKKQFPDVQILLMPWGTSKDFSDYRKKYGEQKTQELINKAQEYYLNYGKS